MSECVQCTDDAIYTNWMPRLLPLPVPLVHQLPCRESDGDAALVNDVDIVLFIYSGSALAGVDGDAALAYVGVVATLIVAPPW